MGRPRTCPRHGLRDGVADEADVKIVEVWCAGPVFVTVKYAAYEKAVAVEYVDDAVTYARQMWGAHEDVVVLHNGILAARTDRCRNGDRVEVHNE